MRGAAQYITHRATSYPRTPGYVYHIIMFINIEIRWNDRLSAPSTVRYNVQGVGRRISITRNFYCSHYNYVIVWLPPVNCWFIMITYRGTRRVGLVIGRLGMNILRVPPVKGPLVSHSGCAATSAQIWRPAVS